MKVAIYSPVRRQGCSTLSILLGAALAKVVGMKVCLTYTGIESDAYNISLGLSHLEDRTRSLTQVIRMLEGHNISGDDIIDYLTPLTDNLDIMQTSSDYITSEESDALLRFVLNNLPHELIITEINSEPFEENTQHILNDVDIVIVLVSQSMDVLNKYKLYRNSKYYPDKGKIIYVINKYDPYISPLKDISNKMGVDKKKVVKISRNPYIVKMANSGTLHKIMPYIINKDIRVLNLYTDIRDLCYLLMSNLGVKINWEDQSSD